ncbi:ABC transporter permease [Bifidobacterium castoris]|nr:ABC transporter permease [Bifidobacterium castoris]
MSVPEQIGAAVPDAPPSPSASSSSSASSAPAHAPSAPRWTRRMARIGAAWASTLVLFALWALCTRSAPDTRALPSPGEVAAAFVDMRDEGALWPSVRVSVLRVLAGLSVGVALAVPAGVVSGASRPGRALIDKPVHMLRAIPFPALAPLLIVTLGIGEAMKVTLIAVGAFALVYVNVRDGVRAIDSGLLELARAYRMPRHVVFTKILLCGVLPQFMTGLRFAITVSWIALVTCETVNSSAGIGYLLARSQQFFRTDQMVLCIVLYAALGLLSEWAVGALERLLHTHG